MPALSAKDPHMTNRNAVPFFHIRLIRRQQTAIKKKPAPEGGAEAEEAV